jgi:hypothetical protein
LELLYHKEAVCGFLIRSGNLKDRTFLVIFNEFWKGWRTWLGYLGALEFPGPLVFSKEG